MDKNMKTITAYIAAGDYLPSQFDSIGLNKEFKIYLTEDYARGCIRGKYFAQIIKCQINIPDNMNIVDNSNLKLVDTHNPELQKLLDLHKQSEENREHYFNLLVGTIKKHFAENPALEKNFPLAIMGLVLGPSINTDMDLNVLKQNSPPWEKDEEFKQNLIQHQAWQKLVKQIDEKINYWRETSDVSVSSYGEVTIYNPEITLQVTHLTYLWVYDKVLQKHIASNLNLELIDGEFFDINKELWPELEKYLKDHEYSFIDDDTENSKSSSNNKFKHKF